LSKKFNKSHVGKDIV